MCMISGDKRLFQYDPRENEFLNDLGIKRFFFES